MPASSALSPRLAYARSVTDTATGHIQFFDSFTPQLPSGNYTLTVEHTVTPVGNPSQTYTATQTVVVAGPEFTLPPGTVQAVYPPDTGTGAYQWDLPFAVLNDPALPWEREVTLVPQHGASRPWVALVIFAENEVVVPAGSTGPVTAIKLGELLSEHDDCLGPALPSAHYSSDVLDSYCQVVTVPAAAFKSVLPQPADVPLLAHTRTVANGGEDGLMVSCLLCNRLPYAVTSTKYYANLISLDGFGPYLGSAGAAIPNDPKTGAPKNVRLVSLYNWSFTVLPGASYTFESLVEGLVKEQRNGGGFALPVSTSRSNPPQAVSDRLAQGYAPVTYVLGSGETSFGWYRGPFSPVVPQALPAIGEPATAVDRATTSDALQIYVAREGIFDASYAAAWQIGRATALASGPFGQALWTLRRAARRTVGGAALRAASPWWQDQPIADLMSRTSAHRRFASLMSHGLGAAWTTRSGGGLLDTQPSPGSMRVSALAGMALRTLWSRADALLAEPVGVEMLGNGLSEQIDPITSFLAQLVQLIPLPFSHLVPNPALLPEESARFFHVDANWLKAALAGALSLALQSSADVRIQRALAPYLTAVEAGMPVAGMLLRSQLVSAWPTMLVTPTAGGQAVTVLRDAVLAPTVRMLLFDAVPDIVTLAEPYQGLRFGIENNGIVLRQLAVAGSIGAQLDPLQTLPPEGTAPAFLAAYTVAGSGGVLTVQALAQALKAALRDRDAAPEGGLGAGGLAIQLVMAPELQMFPSADPAKPKGP